MNAREFAPTALRWSIALVVLWFGISQIIAPSEWTGFLPAWLPTFGLSAQTHVILNGTFEVITGTLLLVGLFTRVAAILAALHLYGITVAVGYSAVGVRDFGLAMAAATVALFGPDALSVDAWRTRRANRN